MSRADNCSMHVLFLASSSILLNVLLSLRLYAGGCGNEETGISWGQTAAEEAAHAAMVNCSGHGRAYLDGIVVDGKLICECNLCYS
ncbi:hypothetical protein SAY86_010314 [Trapa natans]|uniref:Alliinase EGF-like domain-containing protein n=1 Tax=Trapa natans TaxID=22666 RepID=A0AAN7L134_TRANT|nr:hypothetical protein SAY86_010314 [Trapa natans]